jgi:hypothetical protein
MLIVRSCSSWVLLTVKPGNRASRMLPNPLDSPRPPRTAAPFILMRRQPPLPYFAAASPMVPPLSSLLPPEARQCSRLATPPGGSTLPHTAGGPRRAAARQSTGCGATEHGLCGCLAAHIRRATDRPRRSNTGATRTGGGVGEPRTSCAREPPRPLNHGQQGGRTIACCA